jgi:hypothetical protein
MVEKAWQIAADGRNDTYLDSEGRQRVDYENIRRSELRVRFLLPLQRLRGCALRRHGFPAGDEGLLVFAE